MEGFVRVQKTLTDKGTLVPTAELNKYLNDVVYKEDTKDWYTSLFTFGKESTEHFATNGSIAGYNGTAYTNNLVFDLDNEDLDKARQDVDKLLKQLSTKVGLGKDGIRNHVRVYFSGNKGFHVFVKTAKQYSSEELKEYCSIIAEGIESFDPVIYNKTRCFRVANTLNQKSGLYKIPISLELIRDKDGIEKIKELAKTIQSVFDTTVPMQDTSSIDAYIQYHRDHVVKKKSVIFTGDATEINGIRGINNVDFSKSKNIPKCIYALSQGIMVPGKGQRHEIFLHLGNFYRNQGHGPEVVEGILTGIAKLNANLYPEKEAYTKDEIKTQVIKMVFAADDKQNPGGWGVRADNRIFANYCAALPPDSRCPIHDGKNKKSVVKIEEVASDFATFAANFEDNIVTTGIKFLDEHMKISIGTTTLLVGAAGSGKTSLCLSSLERLSKRGQHAMFFSLDMHKNLVYSKLAQRFTSYQQDDIFKFFKERDMKKIHEIHEAVKDNYKNIYLDFSGGLSIDDMKQRIDATEQETGDKVALVIVDYASRMVGPYSDRHQNESYNAMRSKDVADETDAAWIILNQISRNSGDGSTPLRSKRVAKGSGDWEESASNVITVWRPFMGMHKKTDGESGIEYRDEYMRLCLAKNRMGVELEDVLKWNGAKGTVTDMNEMEREEYAKEIEPLERAVMKAKFGK